VNYTRIGAIRVHEDGCRVVTGNYGPTRNTVSGRKTMHYKRILRSVQANSLIIREDIKERKHSE